MITLSNQAIVKIIELLSTEEPNTKLRIFVQGGGCSGFTYGFTFDTELNEDDFEIKLKSDGEYGLLVDSMSLQYLNDAVVDYTEDIMGNSFKISNPQATTTCGCGSSFSV